MASRSKPFSDDLRWVLINMRHAEGLSVDAIVEKTGVKKRTLQRLLQIHKETGGVRRAPRCTRRASKLSMDDLKYFSASIERSPDVYLDELRIYLEDVTGTKVSTSTVWRALKRMGFTLKKVSKAALERNEGRRLRYIFRIGSRYEPDQLVFVDESSFDRRTSYRGYAWALKGRRALRKYFFVRGKRYSMLPALSLDGILWCHIIEGSFNTEKFTNFIDALLDHMKPFPAPNSVVVMDNCRIHKSPELVEMIESRGMKIEFLPAYSPDFNPIEQAFSKCKAFIRRHYRSFAQSNSTGTGLADVTEVYRMLYDAIYSVTRDDARGFFHHSGYL